MFGSDQHPAAAAWLSRLSAVMDEFHELAVGTFTDDQVLALWRDVEAGRRQLAPVDHVLVQEVQSRHLAAAHGAKSMTTFARDVLRVSAIEAKARVAAADALGPRRSFTGEPLAPIYPQVADAQRSGSIGDAAARVIVQTIEKLPDQVRCEQDVACEQLLVEQAQILDVDALRQVAHRLSLTLDPDGLLKDVEYRRKHRDLRLTVRPDGSSHGEFEGTAEFTEWLRTVLDSTARPAPEADGVKDTRTAGQRNHDGLLDAFKLLARAEVLPDVAGITTNVLLTMTPEAFATGEGTATTGHGIVLPVKEAMMWVDGGTVIVPIALNNDRAIVNIGTGQRLFTKRQRLAMIVRDRGCCFPGCTAPPQWTEAHHVIEYADGGPTATDSGGPPANEGVAGGGGCLLCGFHHREFEKSGWAVHMNRGAPEWLPPVWIDPDRKPRTNQSHDPALP